MMKYIPLTLSGFLCACMPHSAPEVKFYTLAPMSGAVSHVSLAAPVIDVERVKIPEYIDRPQIVTISGVNVDVSQHDRWAESLTSMIQRHIITDIATYLPNASVKNSTFMGADGDHDVFIEITRLDGTLGDTVKLDAVYSISDASGRPVNTRFINYSNSVGDTYDDYVTQISKMLDKMARQISQDIADLK